MDDLDKTIAPMRESAYITDDATLPGRRDRRNDGRFQVGDLIMERYKILAELGQGGMGVVYRCLDETAGIEVALKALPPELSHNTLEMEDIKENFQLVAKLVHQNIAISKNLEKDNSNGNYYLIMECCDGEDLRRWIKRKRREGELKLEDILPIIQQVASALDYAHEMKIMHRDIKPGNIMINPFGRIKVLDFGLAAQIHTSMTRVSMAYHGTSGTGPYMAPEQWRGRAQGAAADQYALAVMTYEMLAGRQPFESSDPAVLKQAVLDENPDAIPGVPAAVQKAVFRAMSKEAAERFASCSDFAATLSGNTVRTVSGRRFSKWAAAGILLVVLAAGGTGYYIWDRHQKELARIAEERRLLEEKRIAEAAGVIFNGDYTEIKSVNAKFKKNCTELVIPQGVKVIGKYAFYDCENLSSVTIPNSVKTIGKWAFYDCRNLSSVTIPNSVKTIGDGAFYNCRNLSSVTIPNSVKTIGEYAFRYCENLSSVTIPDSVEIIGDGALVGVKKVNVSAGNADFYTDSAGALIDSKKRVLIYFSPIFEGEYTIPNSVKTIGKYAFYDCENLSSVTIPNSVKTIGKWAFDECKNLTSVSVPKSCRVAENAFPSDTNVGRY